MSVTYELQVAIFDRLVADTNVHALIGDAIYDGARPDDDMPYAVFGPTDVDEDDGDELDSAEVTMQIDVYCANGGRLGPCRQIVDAIKVSLHKFAGSLSVHALTELRVPVRRVFLDEDGKTAHGVLTLVALVEEN